MGLSEIPAFPATGRTLQLAQARFWASRTMMVTVADPARFVKRRLKLIEGRINRGTLNIQRLTLNIQLRWRETGIEVSAGTVRTFYRR